MTLGFALESAPPLRPTSHALLTLRYQHAATTPTTPTPTPTQPCSNAIPDAKGDFLFLVLPSPQKGGRGGVGAQ